jgi:hypothetical protein
VKRITQKSDPFNPRCIVKVFDKYLNPALNRVVQQVTLTEWFVIFLFSKGMPVA